jgi:hypothetical protein
MNLSTGTQERGNDSNFVALIRNTAKYRAKLGRKCKLKWR